MEWLQWTTSKIHLAKLFCLVLYYYNARLPTVRVVVL